MTSTAEEREFVAEQERPELDATRHGADQEGAAAGDKPDHLAVAGAGRPDTEDSRIATGAAEPDVLRPWTSSWARDVVVAVLISAFIIIFLYQPVRVEGVSMLPTLQDEDRLFINKIAYRVGEIHRGDVVVFLYPRDHTKSYIKRVVAVPGDELRIDHGRVFVNGQRLREPYVPRRFEDERSLPEEIVPPHEYFVLGDHRSVASDSRDFGTVDRDLIYGKAAFVYWPMDQMGVVR
jgi:signal peptidase I